MASGDVDGLSERLAREQLAEAQAAANGGTSLQVLNMTAAALRRMDEVAEQSPDSERRACRAGCSSCCYLQVAITVPEALWIADQLRCTLSQGELEAVRARILGANARVSHLTLEQRAAARVPCALLDAGGACGIYEFRPLGCRGFTSFDRRLCDEALAADEPGHSGPMDRVAWAASAAIAEGLARGLAAADVDGAHYELHSAVGRALDQPDAGERWMRGEDVFSDCGRVISERIQR